MKFSLINTAVLFLFVGFSQASFASGMATSRYVVDSQSGKSCMTVCNEMYNPFGDRDRIQWADTIRYLDGSKQCACYVRDGLGSDNGDGN